MDQPEFLNSSGYIRLTKKKGGYNVLPLTSANINDKVK